MEEAAYYGEREGTVYVKAEGHVTARLCPAIKAKLLIRIDAQPPVRGMGFDLSACEYMDSTFLGLIVNLCKRLSAAGARKPTLYGTNDACKALLRTTGILGLVELSEEAAPALPSAERIESGPSATARFLLDAHDALSGLSEENRGRFAALSSVLRKAASEEEGHR